MAWEENIDITAHKFLCNALMISKRESYTWERRLTAGEFTPAISLDVSAGRAERFIGPFEAFEKEVVWLPGAIEKRADWRNGRREFLIDSSRPSLLSSKNCDSIG